MIFKKLTQEEIDLAIKNLNSSNSDCLTLEEIDKLLIELSKKDFKINEEINDGIFDEI